MNQGGHGDRGRGGSLLGRGVALESEVAWLILLSIVDLLLTWSLLQRSGRFYESNPLAAWFFDRFNVAGLVAYKFILIAAVVVIAEFVERVKPGRGRLVLRIGIIAAAAVVVYSAYLGFSNPS